MSSFVRSSKYRHVFADAPKSDQTFSQLRSSTVTGDQSYIKGNGKFFALAVQGGGGPFAVINLDKPGKQPLDLPVIAGHSGATLDFDFNPFHDHMIASGSDDQTVKVWGIPEGGLTSNITEPLVDLHGHGKKVTLVKFHPTASNVLLSASADHTVKLWDIEKGSEINTVSGSHPELIQDVAWDYSGNTYATSCKDKNVRFMDARGATVTSTIEAAHEGAKSVKMTYLGAQNHLLTVGFTKQSMRQFKIWDPRNLSKELKKQDIDQGSGVIMPFFDGDTSILYLAGKGDGNIRYYEIVGDNCQDIFVINDFKSSISTKGAAWIPKTAMNVAKCETARILKLSVTNNQTLVEPLSFTVPRKSETFQDDIYPDTPGTIPAHTADEWLAGSDKTPILQSMNPAKAGSSSQAAFVPKKNAMQLQAELDIANARIAELEAKLAAANLA